jgi:hypothetical protein
MAISKAWQYRRKIIMKAIIIRRVIIKWRKQNSKYQRNDNRKNINIEMKISKYQYNRKESGESSKMKIIMGESKSKWRNQWRNISEIMAAVMASKMANNESNGEMANGNRQSKYQ